MNNSHTHNEWLETVKQLYDQHQQEGGFLILFPSYRPDMSKALAHHLGLKFYDYREQRMQVLGWEAGDIELQDASSDLLEESSNSGVLVHNIESLLATKSTAERKDWFAEFLDADWPNPVVIPISIYQGDILEEHQRVCDLELIPFAKESFIMRLAE